MASSDDSPVNLNRTKSLTCYFWMNKGGCIYPDDACGYAHYFTGKVAEAPVHMVPGRPAVAGANARRASPVYRDWSLVRRSRLLIPAHCAAQIAGIHDRQQQHGRFLELPAPPMSLPLLLPAPASPLSPSEHGLPASPTPASASTQRSPLLLLPPPHMAAQDPLLSSPLRQQLTNHLQHSQESLVENCVDALYALRSFENDYTPRPGVVLPPLPPPDRFRRALNAIIDVATGHGAALEQLEREE